MTDLKQSNRVPWARAEGIFAVESDVPPSLRCTLCGLVLSTSALTRASHGKKHVRAGEAVARTEYGYDGPRTVYEPVVNRSNTAKDCGTVSSDD